MNDETRARIKEAQDQAAKEWNAAFDYIAIRNGVSVGNIKMLHLDEVNTRAMEIICEHSRITELLKEKDEKIADLLENLERIVDRIYEANLNGNFPSAYERAIEAIEKVKGKQQ